MAASLVLETILFSRSAASSFPVSRKPAANTWIVFHPGSNAVFDNVRNDMGVGRRR